MSAHSPLRAIQSTTIRAGASGCPSCPDERDTLTLAALLYVFAATGLGLLMSAFTNSQLAALFGTALATMLPAIQFSGILNPVSTLEGFSALMGQIYPTAPFVTISRGTFSKALGFADLQVLFVPLALSGPVLLVLSVLLLRKQER